MDKEVCLLNDMKDVINLLIRYHNDEDIKEWLECILYRIQSEYKICSAGKEVKEWQRNNIMI